MISFGSIVYFALCYMVGLYAERRGRGKWTWTIISLITSPLFSYIALLILLYLRKR